MTLKIDRFRTRVRLSGELRSEDLDQVKAEIDCCGTSVILDVEEVDLVDVESVRFLNVCEATVRTLVASVSGRMDTTAPDLTRAFIVLTSSTSMQTVGFTPARLNAVSSRRRVCAKSGGVEFGITLLECDPRRKISRGR